jgi:hypothetical protein
LTWPGKEKDRKLKVRNSPRSDLRPAARNLQRTRDNVQSATCNLQRKLVVASIILILASTGASAATLLNYEQRVKRATEQVERIKKDRSYAEEGIASLKVLLPKYEQVDYDGQTITVDNTWLHALLDSYERGADSAVRSAKLNEAEGKLRALDERLIQAQGTRFDSKLGEESRALRDILSRTDYKPKPEDPLTVLRRNIWNRVVEVVTRILRDLSRTAVGAALGRTWVMIVLISVVLAIVLFWLVRMLMRIDFKRKKPASRKVLGEEIPANLTARDIAGAALAAARAGDFRIGIRKLYIACLYELADKGLIDLESNATNRDYFRLVSRHSILSSPMEYLTDRFEYFWYGKYPATSEDFQDYLNRYGVISDRARSVTA